MKSHNFLFSCKLFNYMIRNLLLNDAFFMENKLKYFNAFKNKKVLNIVSEL